MLVGGPDMCTHATGRCAFVMLLLLLALSASPASADPGDPSSPLYLPFVAGCWATIPTPEPTPVPTPNPEPTPPPNSGDDPRWDSVETWVYQLSGYQNDDLAEIAASGFDLAVVDLARDGYTGYFTRDEVLEVKQADKVILAYFEIGAIENYRPEWPDVPDDLKLGSVSGWPGEQYVKYWDDRWWPVVQGRVDQALVAGFDGAYLDMIVTYEEIPAGSAGTDRTDLARKMVALIERLSVYAKQIDPGFKVVPQNSPELHVHDGYLDAIDGLGMEELYVLAMDQRCTASWCYENQENASEVAAA
ncbi:MAG: endo alpha-1,4 polygalactosaminidase, partial [Anaerolineae bacterium]|nr:endo alpha-1,4 polygalactosaminidase [Anaerolineae bacterium]